MTIVNHTFQGVTQLIRESEYHDDEYSMAEVRTYDIGTEVPTTILDVGAHVGSFSVWLKQLYPDVHIIAVEPEPGNYEMLEKNLEQLPNAMALHARLAYDSTPVRLMLHPSHSTCHRIIAVNEVTPEKTTIEAPAAITLEKIMVFAEWDELSILKVDCEGCELDVLMNCSDEVLKHIHRICGEFHNGYDYFIDGIGRRLANLGFLVTAETDPNRHATFTAINQGLK